MESKTALIEKLNIDDLSLEDKLKAIDEAMNQIQIKTKKDKVIAPDDPALLTICDGCE